LTGGKERTGERNVDWRRMFTGKNFGLDNSMLTEGTELTGMRNFE
jgi:hypothetical protein